MFNGRKPLTAAFLVLAAALMVAGCGSDDSPSSTTAQSGNSADRAFIAGMVPHHESAIEMAQVAQDEATSEYLNTLADNIIRSQSAEVAQMKRIDKRLEAAGVDEGDMGMSDSMMGMNMSGGDLKGEMPFDQAFYKAMIRHHQGALMMARYQLKNGQDAALKQLSRDIIAAQQKEIDEMRKLLGDASPSTGGMEGMQDMH